MDADRRSILSAVDREMGLTRREIVAFSGLAGVGALLATIGVQIGEARAQSPGYAEGDLKILNVALGLEHEAIAAYRTAIALDPKCAPAHYGLGAILCDVLRDYENAAASLGFSGTGAGRTTSSSGSTVMNALPAFTRVSSSSDFPMKP